MHARIGKVPDYAVVDKDVLAKLGEICPSLPEAWTEPAWTGHRFLIRKRNFVHVFALNRPDETIDTMLQFRASAEEREVLIASGHPFFQPGWGTDTIGMVITEHVDWTEVEELMIESYCILAPKKLVALVDRPELQD